MKAYTPQVYRFVGATSETSAREIVPLLVELARPRSVVDFGCGTGEWLAAFRELGAAERVLGLDGDWVPRGQLAIAEGEFRAADLRAPVRLEQPFDCALCLEVIGHIPKPVDDTLLDSLTAAAPVLVFSAPIPLQGGIGGDATNREWPAHWAGKLAARGYVAIDCIRPVIWENPAVGWWFAQNLFVAVRRELLSAYPRLAAAHAADGAPPRPLVHPGCFESTLQAAGVENLPLRRLLPLAWRALARRAARRT